MIMKRCRRALALATAAATIVASLGCAASGPTSTGAGGAGGSGGSATFLAFQSDFDGYPSWQSFAMPHLADGLPESDSKLTAYLNERPPSGADEFPVGTIIVKEIVKGPPEGRQSFAMAKRGGGYNPDGAKDWEWFELSRLGGDQARIVWRGAGAPVGEQYASSPNACNDCHKSAAANDYVYSPPLQLKALEGGP
jgi:hypothetical protein